jgi:hypothetical protein
MRIIVVKKRGGRGLSRLVELDVEKLEKQIRASFATDTLSKKLRAVAEAVEDDEITSPEDLAALEHIRAALAEIPARIGGITKTASGHAGARRYKLGITGATKGGMNHDGDN